MKTKLTLITPPAALPVTLAEAKTYLRVDHSEDDTLISAILAAAVSVLDGRNGILGRCLEPATWELALCRFPTCEIRLPLGPVASVTIIIYVDPDGAEQTLDPSEYALDNAETYGGTIHPATAWPASKDALGAVKIQFIAGTGPPGGVKQALLDMAAARYDTRGEGRMLTPGIVADLAPFRRPVVA